MELNFCFELFVCVNFGRTNVNKSQDERRQQKKSHYEVIAHRINTSVFNKQYLCL